MSDREGFTGGFALGAVIGGVIGGIVGVVLAARLSGDNAISANPTDKSLANEKTKRKSLEVGNLDLAHLSLEEKIAQLNQAIDDVRQQLGSENGSVKLERYSEQSLTED
ncbi:MAG: hypothetical protein HC835_09515 [Oscillatoriales cyanobacterium RM2_1_1]|nr:hypothetical protein [Oscillatoriales cyanobacterium SM2_3_0]NJO45841.1 hypothetical protein [Oscillatoriales cyanobacterium RM2_1_1]